MRQVRGTPTPLHVPAPRMHLLWGPTATLRPGRMSVGKGSAPALLAARAWLRGKGRLGACAAATWEGSASPRWTADCAERQEWASLWKTPRDVLMFMVRSSTTVTCSHWIAKQIPILQYCDSEMMGVG